MSANFANTTNITMGNSGTAINGNVWAPRRPIQITCPSGQKVTVRRPGPEFVLKAGRIPRTFAHLEDPELKKRDDETDEEYEQRAERFVGGMSDEEQDGLVAFARELLVAMVVYPRLVLNPDYDKGQIGPDDTGKDFWFLYQYGMDNFMGVKVTAGTGEVEVSDLKTFREESGVSGDSVDSAHLPIREAEPDPPDSGLVNSAGD
jgi:hypothetical protein